MYGFLQNLNTLLPYLDVICDLLTISHPSDLDTVHYRAIIFVLIVRYWETLIARIYSFSYLHKRSFESLKNLFLYHQKIL